MAIDPDRQPRVLIYGAGAVGCFLGGVLAEAGCSVTLLARGDLVRTISENGLALERPGSTSHAWPNCVESIDQIEHTPDLIFQTVRTFSVERALDEIAYVYGPGTTLITVQNGVGTEELVRARLPNVSLIAASLTLSAEFTATGRVRSTSRSGGIALAAVAPSTDARGLASIFHASGLNTSVISDYRSMKWSKLLLNMMGNATSAILDWPPGCIYRDRSLYRLERDALLEAVAVMQAEGARPVSLPGFPVPVLPWIFRLPARLGQALLLPRVGSGRGAKMPSLHLDMSAGRTETEARWMYGVVVEAGERAHIGTPVNRRLLRIYEGVLRNPRLREAFRGNPERLLRNIALGADYYSYSSVHKP